MMLTPLKAKMLIATLAFVSCLYIDSWFKHLKTLDMIRELDRVEMFLFNITPALIGIGIYFMLKWLMMGRST